jgi:hypothetical protein
MKPDQEDPFQSCTKLVAIEKLLLTNIVKRAKDAGFLNIAL